MPEHALNSSQMTTIGAQALAILWMPKGWTRKSRIRMAQDTPMIVPVEMFEFTTVRPWIAPRTDWAGVSSPSAMIRLTPRTARILRRACAIVLFSSQPLMPAFEGYNSFVR
jgi:hypothetical protein